MFEIRIARNDDLHAITDIYNSAILNSTATFDTTPRTVEEQEKWFSKHGQKYPIFVAEINSQVLGWASLSPWSDRCAYSETAEVSFYVRENDRGKGIGRALLEKLVTIAPILGIHTLVSRISGDSDISIHLHKVLGFEKIGTMKEVGRKFGKLLDVHLMQKLYSNVICAEGHIKQDLEWKNGHFTLSTDKSRLQVQKIYRFLSQEAYWSLDIPLATVERAIAGSLCFGLFDQSKDGYPQIGFARIVRDGATFAWLCDVYIEKNYRGLGLSKWLMECLMSHPDLKGLRRICLATRDAHKLYEKYGFEVTKTPENWLEIKDNDLYKKLKQKFAEQ